MGPIETTDFDGIHPPLMEWQPVSGATRYVVSMSVAGADSFTAAHAGTNRSGFAYTGENTTLADMLTPGSYDFYVSALNASGTLLEKSSTGRFVVTAWPTAELQSPTCRDEAEERVVCVLHDTPRLDWIPMANVGSYRVYIAKDPNFTNIVKESVAAFSELTLTESLPDSQAGESYYWYVRPCAGGLCGPFDTSVFDKAGVFRKESMPVQALSPMKTGSLPSRCRGRGDLHLVRLPLDQRPPQRSEAHGFRRAGDRDPGGARVRGGGVHDGGVHEHRRDEPSHRPDHLHAADGDVPGRPAVLARPRTTRATTR